VNCMLQKYKSILIGIGIGVVLGVTQGGGNVPGITDTSASQDNFPMLIGMGIAAGFFMGLANLSKANPNPQKAAAFACFITIGVVALVINIYRGFIGSNIGFNIIALVSMGYIPSMIVGGYAASLFSKNS
jgi:hypothetical protein